MRIGQKLILGFVGITLLIGVVGYISVNTSQKALEKTIGESSVTLAQKTIDAIDRIIYRRIERWQSYDHTNPRLSETVIASNQEFEKLDNIQSYINEKDKEWTSAPKKEITPFMKGLIDNKLSQRLRKRIDFYAKKYGYKVFGEVFVTNKHGANVAQTGKTSDYYQADEEWWQVAKKDGFYIRDVEYDESADIYSTDFALKVDDEAGNFLGVMKVVLNIEEIINVIKEVKPRGMHEEHTTRKFKLLTKDGKIIYSTEEFEFFQNMPKRLLSQFKKGKGHAHYFITEDDIPAEEEEKLFSYAYSKGYKDYNGLGWILIVEYETEEIFAPVAKLRNTLLIVSGGILIIAILIGLFISRSISGPIAKLTGIAAEIGRGKLDTKIEIKSKDEIGDFAKSFSRMTENLSKSRDELISAKDYTDNIVKSMVDTLIVVDPEAKIKTINNATSDLLGYTEDELIRKPVATIFAEEEEEEEEEESPFKGTRMKKLIEEGSIRDYDMTYKTKAGEKIPVSFSGSVMRDKEGELVGIVGIARDMREIKRLMQKEKEFAAAAAAADAEKKRAEELEKSYKETQQKTIELEKSYKELSEKSERLERFSKVTVGRELEMVSLKKEINSLLKKSGQPKKYKVS